MEKVLIGIDIGGSTIKMGILNTSGQILQSWEIKTQKDNKADNIVADIWSSINGKLPAHTIKNNVLGIGVGAPGFVDKKSGLVYEAVNIGWKNFDLGKSLKGISNLPVFVENDANLAALGENWKGAGDNADNIIVITLGTGVGSGIIVNGAILSGYNGTASEIGHITVNPQGLNCNCGKKGCLDTIASGPGIENKALEMIAKYPSSDLAKFYKMNNGITAKDVFDLARNENELCENIVNNMGKELGCSIATVATIINPSKVLIGGGLSKAGDQLLNAVKPSFKKYVLPRIYDSCKLEIAKLGNDAGIIGAANLAIKSLNESN